MKDHKLAAIVFTDIVGYTRKMEADEEGTMKLLAKQREIVFPMVKDFGGEVIKEIGDGLMMMFTSANRAVRFAIAVQEKLTDDDLTIRAGIHIGDVIFEEGDVFGSAVNIAARIEPLAPAGGICISEDVRSQIRNQGDILTSSIGKKELKGVKEVIEVFSIVSDEMKESRLSLPFHKDLWQRRVIQISALYIALAFLVRLGTEYMVGEYNLSPNLTILIWYILLSLIPSIILVSYFHGRKGVSKWTRVELIGMPLNIILALIILILIFKGKDLGAITTTVTVLDEDGRNVEKVVVRSKYRKNIMIYNLENISEDTSLNYLQYGIPSLTQFDLAQDIFISAGSGMDLLPRMVSEGYEEGIGVPLTLMAKYAKQRQMTYFLFGTLDMVDNEYKVDIKLYNSKMVRLITEISVQDNSPFGLADKLSLELKKAMGLSDSHISETIDLPISERFTNSEKALYYFSRSLREKALINWHENTRLLELALKEDPGFAIAYAAITISYLNISNMDAARKAVDEALKVDYKLSERQQFAIKYVYFVLNQQPEKATNVAKMWVEVYPDDIGAHTTLAERYTVRSMFDEAINEYKEIYRLDPERYEILSTVGNIYMKKGQLDSALVYFQEYALKLPNQTSSFTQLGDFYKLTGELQLAKENYEKAMLRAEAHQEISININLAGVMRRSGEYDQAHELYMESLKNSETGRDSGRVYDALEKFHLAKGQAKRSLEYYKLKLPKYRSLLAPKDYLVYRIFTIESFVHAGEIEAAFSFLEEALKQFEPPLDKLVPFGYMMIYAEIGETEKALKSMEGAEDLIKGFGEEMLMANVYHSQAKIHESLEEYENAIENYYKFLETNAMSYIIHTDIASCYRRMNELDKAEKEIQISLKYNPFNATVNFEAALLYFDMGDDVKGLEHLERAVEVWKDADSDYEKANKAMEKFNSMNN